MNWKAWKIGLLVAVVTGILTVFVGWTDGMTLKALGNLLIVTLAKDTLLYLKDHPVNIDPTTSPKLMLWLFLLMLGSLVAFGPIGCAALKPGADALVVRVEQTQTAAKGAFDLVLHVDQADRGFWRTNAPAFHDFCDFLRTPLPYETTNVPRCVAMEFNVDDLKLAYKASKTTGSSNALWSAWSVLDALLGQASSWQTIVTHPVH